MFEHSRVYCVKLSTLEHALSDCIDLVAMCSMRKKTQNKTKKHRLPLIPTSSHEPAAKGKPPRLTSQEKPAVASLDGADRVQICSGGGAAAHNLLVLQLHQGAAVVTSDKGSTHWR